MCKDVKMVFDYSAKNTLLSLEITKDPPFLKLQFSNSLKFYSANVPPSAALHVTAEK